MRRSSSQTKRATAALAVTAAGDFLTPMIIFKGKPDGLIARRELPTLDPTSIYACQDAAWMDERCMLTWVNEVLHAYLVANPPPEGVQPVLLLDSYRCHMMASVVSRIEAMGVHVIHIASGCTGLTQPLDVGINQSFKARCRRMWEEWLVHLIDTTNEVRDATREEVSEWAAAVFWELVGSRILRNSWRKTGFDWFPGVVDPDDIVEGGEGGDDGVRFWEVVGSSIAFTQQSNIHERERQTKGAGQGIDCPCYILDGATVPFRARLPRCA